MPTYTFPAIRAYREQAGKCPTCRKRVVRKFNDYMTVNPFNRGADGSPKTHDEVRADINAKADAWVPNFEHADCADARGDLPPERVAEIVDGLPKRATNHEIRTALRESVSAASEWGPSCAFLSRDEECPGLPECAGPCCRSWEELHPEEIV